MTLSAYTHESFSTSNILKFLVISLEWVGDINGLYHLTNSIPANKTDEHASSGFSAREEY